MSEPQDRPAGKDQNGVTNLLRAWRGGDHAAFDALLSIVYDELRHMAEASLRSERKGHTLQPTALVHEAYLRLVKAEVPWEDRAHFFSIAARTMRRILIDHARYHASAKRGAGWVRTTLASGIALSSSPALELVHLDEALEQLLAENERAARAAELHYFGGLSYEDTAKALGISAATVHRDLRFARAWLYHEISQH